MSHGTDMTDIGLPHPIALAPPPGEAIHRRLLWARVDAGVTLARMDRALGVNPQQMQRYETAQNPGHTKGRPEAPCRILRSWT